MRAGFTPQALYEKYLILVIWSMTGLRRKQPLIGIDFSDPATGCFGSESGHSICLVSALLSKIQ